MRRVEHPACLAVRTARVGRAVPPPDLASAYQSCSAMSASRYVDDDSEWYVVDDAECPGFGLVELNPEFADR